MRSKNVFVVAGAALAAIGAIEACYKHPTLGNGVQAFVAAVALGKLL